MYFCFTIGTNTHRMSQKECENYLVEKWTVRDRKSESIEAHSQHHVIRCVIAVALAATVKQLDNSLPAEHHAAATHRRTSETRKRTHTTAQQTIDLEAKG